MRLILILAMLMLAIPTNAAPPVCSPAPVQAQVQAYQTYAAPVVYQHVIAAVFVPLSSYTVGLSHASDDGRLDEILRRLDSIEDAQPQRVLDPAAVLLSDCRRCHSGDEAKGGFRLDLSLSAEQRALAIEQVTEGKMPPGKPLSVERRRAVVRGLVQ